MKEKKCDLIVFRAKPSLKNKLERIAEEENKSSSQLIREILYKKLKNKKNRLYLSV